MLLTGVTAFAAEPAAAPSQNAAVSARASGNLALNKAATASDVESGTSFTANLAVDGMANTRWASNQDSTGAQQPRWLQIDFGATTTFDTVDIYWEQQNIDAYQLQVSTDASEWETVYERNSPPVSTYESVTLTAPAIGRYLRVYVTGYDYNVSWHSVSIYEVEVYDSTGEVPVEPQGNYQIYPIPQKVTDEEGTAPVTDTVTVIAEEGIDQVTRSRVDEVLTENDLTPVYSESPNEDTTNLYIGVNGSGGLADSHEGIPREVFAEGENKYDMHVVKVFADGDIVILGKDSDAAYYGLATLEQMLDQSETGTLKISTFEDYAFQKYRGAVEGYYGYPWSVEGTLSWFDFAKRYKMNIFLYGPKTDPYHLGQWDEDYPTEVTEEEAEIGIRTQDEMRQFAEKAAQCNVDFVWVAHPAMKKPIDFTNEETVDEGVERLMAKFDHMYDLGVRQFGIFVDDITPSAAASSCDMQIYMLNQVQEKLYDTYNTEGAAPEDQVKPLFFTPAWYTTITSGASTYMPRFKNVHEDIEICFTGNNVFSDISNVSAATFKNWIGRDPVMWWNYPVNDNVDSVYYTNPIDHFYSLDSNPSNLKGVLSNPMNFSEASKVAFFGLADYTWNPGAFDAQENWENCFDAILPDDPEMAQYADYIVPDVTQYESFGFPVLTRPGGYGTTVRWEASKPKVMQLDDGRYACWETLLIDIAKACDLPGWGEGAFTAADGTKWDFNNVYDYYAKALANLAYAEETPVDDITPEEMEMQGLDELPESWKAAVSAEEWPKVLQVLSRGGRFWPIEQSYDDQGRTNYAQSYMTCFYNESKGTARNHYTGEYESGVLRWQPETCADRTPLRDLYPKSEWPFTSTNYKPKFRSISMLANSPIMRQICPANYIEMNTADAESLGIANGDWVDVENPTGDVMHAQALVRDGIAYGTFAVAYGYGHFAYGAQDLEIDGEKRPGDPAIGAGVHLQTMLDPKVEGVLPISDPEAATPGRSGGVYRIAKASERLASETS